MNAGRPGDTELQTVLVNAADWTVPDGIEIPEGWVIGNAPRPIRGELHWNGPFRHGVFYAAAPEIPVGSWGWKADDAWLVTFITDAEIRQMCLAKIAEHGYGTLEEAGLTVGEVAAMMQLPYAGAAAG